MRVLVDWLLTPHRAAVHLPTRTAVIADLHLGYAEARRRAGDAVPHAGLDALRRRLTGLAAEYRVRHVVVAGDLFETRADPETAGEFLALAKRLNVDVTLVPGNHDRGFEASPGLPLCADGFRLGRWRVVHGHGPRPRGRAVMGHFHPWLRLAGQAGVPCYLVEATTLILPAFSDDAAGVNVLSDRRWRAFRCAAIAGKEIIDLGDVAHLRRRPARRPVGP